MNTMRNTFEQGVMAGRFVKCNIILMTFIKYFKLISLYLSLYVLCNYKSDVKKTPYIFLFVKVENLSCSHKSSTD